MAVKRSLENRDLLMIALKKAQEGECKGVVKGKPSERA
jgi:hypothetical protein